MQEREFETVNWSYDDERHIGYIELNRPDSMNALSDQLRADVVSAFDAFEEIDREADGVEVRAVIVSGAGDRAFCAGADVNEFLEVNPGQFERSRPQPRAESYEAPVIAKIDGYCLGGGLELALACDFRYASERSTVGQPEIDLGIIPGGGGTQRLPEIVGPSRAKEICITGEHIPARDAAEEGLLDHVVPAEELDDAVEEFAETIAEKPPLAARAVKDVINSSQNTPLSEGLKYERRALLMLRTTEDNQEGAAAFVEDREPEFVGR